MSLPRDDDESGQPGAQPSHPHHSSWSDGEYGVAQPLDGTGSSHRRTPQTHGRHGYQAGDDSVAQGDEAPSKFRAVLRRGPQLRGPKIAWALFIFGILLAFLTSAVIAPWVRQIEHSAPLNRTVTINIESTTDLWIWTTAISENADACVAESAAGETRQAQRAGLGVETRHRHDETNYPMTATHVVTVGEGSWTVGCTDELRDGTSWGEVFAVSHPVSMGWHRFADNAMSIGATAIGVSLVIFVVSSATSFRRRANHDEEDES